MGRGSDAANRQHTITPQPERLILELPHPFYEEQNSFKL
jgi:hypothetical protein